MYKLVLEYTFEYIVKIHTLQLKIPLSSIHEFSSNQSYNKKVG